MNCILLKYFLKKFDSYNPQEQELILNTLNEIKTYLETQQASDGLRIKKLSAKIFEARINIHLRIAFFKEKDVVKFLCLGNHDDIRRCLKNLRQLIG